MFKCKVCLEKDKMIQELSKQVEILRTLAYPNQTSNSKAFMQSIEANKILNGDTSGQVLMDHSVQNDRLLSEFHNNWS